MNIEPAYKRLLFQLERRGYLVNFVEPINQGRYLIIKGSLYENPHNILILYKREPFFSFGEILKEYGAVGTGESINLVDVKLALQNNVTEVFLIYPNASAYSINLCDFLTSCIYWQNREGKEIRSIALNKFKFEFKI